MAGGNALSSKTKRERPDFCDGRCDTKVARFALRTGHPVEFRATPLTSVDAAAGRERSSHEHFRKSCPRISPLGKFALWTFMYRSRFENGLWRIDRKRLFGNARGAAGTPLKPKSTPA